MKDFREVMKILLIGTAICVALGTVIRVYELEKRVAEIEKRLGK